MLFKKILSGVLASAITMTAGIIPQVVTVSAEEVPKGFKPIHNIEELYAINNAPHDNYILMNDIDMTEDTAPGGDWDLNGTGWEPLLYMGQKIGIAGINYTFNGEFDGNGHAIIGMNIHGEPEFEKVGLFYQNGGNIHDLKMIDVNINVKNSYCVGAIVGENSYNGYISNCFSHGDIIADEAGYVGGIVGRAEESYGGSCDFCYNAATIKSDGYNCYVGGITGYWGSSYDCYNIGKIISQSSNKGAIVGTEDDCYNCYYLNGTCENQKSMSSKCMGLSEAQMKVKSIYTDWDFDKIWVIDKTSSYKYPQLRSCMQFPVTSISVVSAPDKMEYSPGSEIDLTGGKISVYHAADNTTAEIDMTKDMLGSYNMNKSGTQVIDVTYLGAKTLFEIEISDCDHELEHKSWGKCVRCGEIPVQVDIMKAKIETKDLLKNPEYGYNPNFDVYETITYDGYTLKENIDYIIDDITDADGGLGECTFKVLGIGCFTGSVIGKFYIKCDHYFVAGKCKYCNESKGSSNNNPEDITNEDGYVKGDISGNGKVDLYDAIIIAKFLLGTVKFNEEEVKIADFNDDGKVTIYDAIAIAKYILTHK